MSLVIGVVCAVLTAQKADVRAPFHADIPIVPVRVSDDDGGRRAAITPAQLKRWVEHGNFVYGPAGIRFLYNTADGMVERRSTLLNNPVGTGDRDWLAFKRAGNRLAAEHPGKLTMIFRHGPGAQPSGGGFSWVDYDFVVMPGFDVTTICGTQNLNVFPHEVGHYLGLTHTFAKEFETVAEADAWLRDHQGDVSSFDGDGLSDTPSDPFIKAIQCDRAQSVVLGGKPVRFDRSNIMGYWNAQRHTFSRQQIEIMRWFVRRRRQSGMLLTATLAWRSPLEAETAEITESRGLHSNLQPMDSFGAGNWSGDAQLYVGGNAGDALTFSLPVATSGPYQVIAYLTMAPDFGRVQPWLDGERTGDPIDLYAPRVIASGRVLLVTRRLEAGRHTVRFEIVGKSAASRGTAFGIDCFEVAPVER